MSHESYASAVTTNKTLLQELVFEWLVKVVQDLPLQTPFPMKLVLTTRRSSGHIVITFIQGTVLMMWMFAPVPFITVHVFYIFHVYIHLYHIYRCICMCVCVFPRAHAALKGIHSRHVSRDTFFDTSMMSQKFCNNLDDVLQFISRSVSFATHVQSCAALLEWMRFVNNLASMTPQDYNAPCQRHLLITS